jgi:hypothetical protein
MARSSQLDMILPNSVVQNDYTNKLSFMIYDKSMENLNKYRKLFEKKRTEFANIYGISLANTEFIMFAYQVLMKTKRLIKWSYAFTQNLEGNSLKGLYENYFLDILVDKDSKLDLLLARDISIQRDFNFQKFDEEVKALTQELELVSSYFPFCLHFS